MMHARDIASRLGLKRYSRSWRGRCPCCEYGTPTFAVLEGREGRARLYCANGCDRSELAPCGRAINGTGSTCGSKPTRHRREPAQPRARARTLAWRRARLGNIGRALSCRARPAGTRSVAGPPLSNGHAPPGRRPTACVARTGPGRRWKAAGRSPDVSRLRWLQGLR